MDISKPDETATPLQSAAEVAKNKVPFDETPTTTRFYKALREGAHLPPEILLGGKAQQITATTIQALSWSGGNVVCSQEELAALRDLEAEYQAILRTGEKYSFGNVSTHLNAKRDELTAAMQRGEDVSGIILEDRETVQHTFRQKQTALNQMLRALTQQKLIPLAKPVLERFEQAIEEHLKYTEIGDRAGCEAWGLEYQPSQIYRAGTTAAVQFQTARRLPPAHAYTTPKKLLDRVVEI